MTNVFAQLWFVMLCCDIMVLKVVIVVDWVMFPYGVFRAVFQS